MISAPRLPDDIDAQAAVEDLAPQMNKYGPDCVLYNLSFCSVFDNWEASKMKYTEWVLNLKYVAWIFLRIFKYERNYLRIHACSFIIYCPAQAKGGRWTLQLVYTDFSGTSK